MSWKTILIDLINGYNYFIIFYFLVLNIIYLIILLFSMREIYFYLKRSQYEGYFSLLSSSFLPGVSILVPCYNEENTIVDNVESLLNLEYNEMEVIVINDGSTDQSLAELKAAFELHKIDRVYKKEIETAEINDIYLSAKMPDLVVIDKENGGKADALNTGVNLSDYNLVTAIDADSILETDSLLKIVMPFVEDSKRVAATGGLVRIANNSKIDSGFMEEPKLPEANLARFQVIEYLRAFFTSRMGWSKINSLLIVSGAFGVFKKDILTEVGGYTADTVGEDMELIVKIHRYLRGEEVDYKISLVPDATCWTQGPSDIKSFISQRKRWQRGLMDSIINHGKLLFNLNYGLVGLFAFPYYVIFEMLGPLLEILGYFSMGLAYFFDLLRPGFVGVFFLLAVLYGVFVSTSAVLIEVYTEQKYSSILDYLKLFLYSILENFGYRQFNTIVRAISLIGYNHGENEWGTISKDKFNNQDIDAKS